MLKSHEQLSAAIVRHDEKVRKALGDDRAERIADLLIQVDEGKKRSLEKDIIVGPADADKLDYLLRDSHFCGVAYGRYDLDKIIDSARERQQMRRLSKSAPHTWSNGSGSTIPDSDLDHVLAADHLALQTFGGSDVSVRGWPERDAPAERDERIATSGSRRADRELLRPRPAVLRSPESLTRLRSVGFAAASAAGPPCDRSPSALRSWRLGRLRSLRLRRLRPLRQRLRALPAKPSRRRVLGSSTTTASAIGREWLFIVE